MINNLETKKPQSVRDILDTPGVRKRFEDMLGKKAPGFISSIISAVSSNSALTQCDQGSVISAAAVAASLDLPINSSLGFAHIVPYKGKAQFQMGWKGYIQLAQRTGMYHKIEINDVLEGQIVSHNKFTGDFVFGEETSDKVVGFMLYFRLSNGFEKYFYMTKDACMAHGKKYSQSFGSQYGRWKLDEDAMCRKTVVKMGLSKFGILSIDMQRAVVTDQATISESGEVESYPDAIDVESKYSVPDPIASDVFGCEICGTQITEDVNNDSMRVFGKSFCIEHQQNNVTAPI